MTAALYFRRDGLITARPGVLTCSVCRRGITVITGAALCWRLSEYDKTPCWLGLVCGGDQCEARLGHVRSIELARFAKPRSARVYLGHLLGEFVWDEEQRAVLRAVAHAVLELEAATAPRRRAPHLDNSKRGGKPEGAHACSPGKKRDQQTVDTIP